MSKTTISEPYTQWKYNLKNSHFLIQCRKCMIYHIQIALFSCSAEINNQSQPENNLLLRLKDYCGWLINQSPSRIFLGHHQEIVPNQMMKKTSYLKSLMTCLYPLCIFLSVCFKILTFKHWVPGSSRGQQNL